MASQASAARKRLKRLAKEIPDDRVINLLDQLVALDSGFTDYLIAINGGTLIDKTLEAAILARFVNLDDDDRKRLFDYDQRGPISDFAARIKVGFALGLYGPRTRHNLDLMRDIRNAFAHAGNHFLTFEKKEIADLWAEMKNYRRATVAIGSGFARGGYVLFTKLYVERLRAQVVPKSGILNQLTFPVNDPDNDLP